MDSPVRGWSSGMLTRLGFAVAVHARPDVLLVDEVLAVGDERFQGRSFAAVAELRAQGVATVFVSHNLGLVKRVADRVLVLERGRVVAIEPPDRAVGLYVAGLGRAGGAERARLIERARVARYGGGEAAIESLRLTDAAGVERVAVVHGGALRIEVEYTARAPVPEARLSVALFRAADSLVAYAVNTAMDGLRFELETKGRAAITFPRVTLLPGRYEVTVTLRRGEEVLDQHDRTIGFDVVGERPDLGVAWLEHEWDV
jgi:lipopolysaccharide transport system ATP-binding protein